VNQRRFRIEFDRKRSLQFGGRIDIANRNGRSLGAALAVSLAASEIMLLPARLQRVRHRRFLAKRPVPA
jgi:hypothetical protein